MYISRYVTVFHAFESSASHSCLIIVPVIIINVLGPSADIVFSVFDMEMFKFMKCLASIKGWVF